MYVCVSAYNATLILASLLLVDSLTLKSQTYSFNKEPQIFVTYHTRHPMLHVVC